MKRFLFAGFGGQGVLFMGRIIAQAAMNEGKQVTWLPSYGPEMRGGTANCSVIISEKKIGSPMVSKPDIAVMMNAVSYQKFYRNVVAGGILFVNSSIVSGMPERDDIQIVNIPVNDMAHEIGKDSVANIIMLGAMQAARSVLSDAAVRSALHEIGGKSQALVELNEQAMQAGYQFALECIRK